MTETLLAAQLVAKLMEDAPKPAAAHLDLPALAGSEYFKLCASLYLDVRGRLIASGDRRLVVLSIPLEDSVGPVVLGHFSISKIHQVFEPPSIYCLSDKQMFAPAHEEYRRWLTDAGSELAAIFRSWKRSEGEELFQNGVYVWAKEDLPELLRLG